MAWDPGFEAAFEPKAVAFVGASRTQGSGGNFMSGFQKLGFQGRMYPINPKADEILGQKAYPDMKSLPEKPDLVIVSVPAPLVPAVLEECGSLGIKNIHIFTAGFDETGTQVGRELGEKVKRVARQYGLRLVGPNCMGLTWFPKVGMGSQDSMERKVGPISFVSQSGMHCGTLVAAGHKVGVHFNKVISFGNGYGLTGTDFLEYLATDPETEIICMYLEGGQDGHRLFELVRDTIPRKPVIIWKGGLTESGARAVSSHTGSLGGQAAIWEGFFRQTGAVQVNSIDEMADVLQCFLRLPPPAGRRVATILIGGGASVAHADICSREGLTLPPLAPETMAELSQFIPSAGNIIRNPLDIMAVFRNADSFRRALGIVSGDPSIDSIIVSMNLGMGPRSSDSDSEEHQKVLTYLMTEGTKAVRGKPLLALVEDSLRASKEEIEAMQRRLAEAGLAVFPSLFRAARSLSLYQRYHARIAGRSESAVLSGRSR